MTKVPKTRAKKEKSEYKKTLNKFHKVTPKHVLIVELDMPFQEKCKVFKFADLERKAYNELVGIMKKNINALMHCKEYKNLRKEYFAIKNSEDEKRKEELKAKFKELEKKFEVTKKSCENFMQIIAKKYRLCSIFGLTLALNVWSGIEKILYKDGKELHFKSKDDELPSIRATQPNRGIIFHPDKENHTIHFSINLYNHCEQEKEEKLKTKRKENFKHQTINCKILPNKKDKFQQEEIDSIITYMEQPEVIDKKAIELFEKTGEIINTYRPCYGELVCKEIRGKLRVFLHITIEGKPKPKYNKKGELKITPNHMLGKGIVGNDIGTRSVAYVSKDKVGLDNLGERGSSIKEIERKLTLILRAMERSRRASNPNNYNEDGTIKKGKKNWKYSNRYRKLKQKYKNLCRKSAINRKLSHNEKINYMRSLGDIFITESKNANRLKKKAKKQKEQENEENEENEENKQNKENNQPITKESKSKETNNSNIKKRNKRRKRFGHSIQSCSPGYYQVQAKRKFESSGGIYIEVPNNYRASQYDHTVDDFVKKELNDRMFQLKNGTMVQRDMYSAFLLYNINQDGTCIDKESCNKTFDNFLKLQNEIISYIKENNIEVANSGISVKKQNDKVNKDIYKYKLRKRKLNKQRRKKRIEMKKQFQQQ